MCMYTYCVCKARGNLPTHELLQPFGPLSVTGSLFMGSSRGCYRINFCRTSCCQFSVSVGIRQLWIIFSLKKQVGLHNDYPRNICLHHKGENRTIINKQIEINIKFNKNKTKVAYKTFFSHHIPIISQIQRMSFIKSSANITDDSHTALMQSLLCIELSLENNRLI